MFAPVGQWWTLAKVHWWGGWADGEHVCFLCSQLMFDWHSYFFSYHVYFQCDTLVQYLLNKLHAYETDYSDALSPISCDTDASLAGEHVLTRPASTEELCMVHASVAADVNGLCNDMRSLTSVVVQAACTTAIALQHLDSSHCFTNVSEPASPTTTPPPVGTVQQLLSHRPVVIPMPTVALSTSNTPQWPWVPATVSISQQKLPTPGLVIPRVPVTHSDSTSSPKNKSWKEIVEHWLVGNWDWGLTMPLKGWPREWYQGVNRQFTSKYHQRATIALEFINQ
jgi:hypothetical protein